MAQTNLDALLSIIESASNGEEVRDAIITAVAALNTYGVSNAHTLDGHEIGDFLMTGQADFLPLDTEPREGSIRGITSGAVFETLGYIQRILASVVGGNEAANRTAVELVNRLSQYRYDIQNAIQSKGQSPGDTLSDYADSIRAITDVQNVRELTVNKNGTYPEEGQDENIYYRPVKVEVTPNLVRKDVRLDTDGVSVSGTSVSANFSPENEPQHGQEPCEGYSQVSVNLDLSSRLTELTLGNGGKEVLEFGKTYNISDFSTTDKPLIGWTSVTVNMDTSKTWTVTFRDEKNTILQTVENVPYGGYAKYTGPEPKKAGHVFDGWNPPPTNITTDTDCVAQFISDEEAKNGSKQVSATWSEIAASGAAKIALGSYKTLSLGDQNVKATLIAKGRGSYWAFTLKNSNAARVFDMTKEVTIRKSSAITYVNGGGLLTCTNARGIQLPVGLFAEFCANNEHPANTYIVNREANALGAYWNGFGKNEGDIVAPGTIIVTDITVGSFSQSETTTRATVKGIKYLGYDIGGLASCGVPGGEAPLTAIFEVKYTYNSTTHKYSVANTDTNPKCIQEFTADGISVTRTTDYLDNQGGGLGMVSALDQLADIIQSENDVSLKPITSQYSTYKDTITTQGCTSRVMPFAKGDIMTLASKEAASENGNDYCFDGNTSIDFYNALLRAGKLTSESTDADLASALGISRTRLLSNNGSSTGPTSYVKNGSYPDVGSPGDIRVYICI